jgi:hypothetical protein
LIVKVPVGNPPTATGFHRYDTTNLASEPRMPPNAIHASTLGVITHEGYVGALSIGRND